MLRYLKNNLIFRNKNCTVCVQLPEQFVVASTPAMTWLLTTYTRIVRPFTYLLHSHTVVYLGSILGSARNNKLNIELIIRYLFFLFIITRHMYTCLHNGR